MEKFLQFLQKTMPINDDKANIIASQFTDKSFQKGGKILEEGNISNEYIFLESGCMRSYLYDTEGEEITINFYVRCKQFLK